MTDEKELSSAERFRAAADEARKALAAGISDDAAPEPESGSSPADGGAESDVPEASAPAEDTKVVPEEAPKEVAGEIVIDPDTAWNEYKDEDARKKALAHNKAYAATMSKKAKELEAKLAELEQAKPKEADIPVPEVKPELDYDSWIKVAVEKAETEEQQKVAALVNEYNQFVTGKYAEVQKAQSELEAKVAEASTEVKTIEGTLKYLQGRKDPSLYESEILEAKQALIDAKLALADVKTSAGEARLNFRDAESDRLAKLGLLRAESRTAHEQEVKARRDSVSREDETKKQTERQQAIDKAWEEAKIKAVEARKIEDPLMRQFLMSAADGAMVRAAQQKQVVTVEEFEKFVNEALKPTESLTERARKDAAKKIVDLTSEPTPSRATSSKPNLDAQPISYDDYKKKARAIMSGKAS